MRKLAVVLGSLVGALAIHGVLAACTTTTIDGSGIPSANAQVTPAGTTSTCKSWKASTFFAKDFMPRPQTADGYGDFKEGLAKELALPAGWEPLGLVPYPVGNGQNYGAIVTARSCAD